MLYNYLAVFISGVVLLRALGQWVSLHFMQMSKCSKKVPVTCVHVNEHKEHGSAKPYLTDSLERHETNVNLAICFVIFLELVCLL